MARFIDEAKINVKAGDGGNGCVAFRREKFEPRGGPSGGNGGDGGNIFIEVRTNLSTLLDFRYRTHFEAERGGNGSGSNKQGRQGEDTIIPVPAGTLVYETREGSNHLLFDLVQPGEKVLVVRGGRGGRGNASFKTPTFRAPRKATPGTPGEERDLFFQLKLIADVGITGFPNSGKSTLLAGCTQARPKTAAYPFTTLTPVLGVATMAEGRTLILADIPGLIEGAAEGKGLGHRFLKHIERTRLLVFLFDLSTGQFAEEYAVLKRELASYSQVLAEKERIVVGNKADIPEARDNIKRFRKDFPEARCISGLTGEGVRELLEEIGARLTDKQKGTP